MTGDRNPADMFLPPPARRRGRRGAVVDAAAIAAAEADIREFLDWAVPFCRMADGGALMAELLAAQRVLDAESEAVARGGGLHTANGLDQLAEVIMANGAAAEPIARRFVVACIEVGRPVPEPLHHLATSTARGGRAKPAKANFRDTVIAEAVNVGLRHGLNPTRSSENATSACSIVADMAGKAKLANVGEKMVERVWRQVARE